jgi:primary-amine oxidase
MDTLRLRDKTPHPLEQLTIAECNQARDFVRRSHKDAVIDFRTISLEEPPKAQLQKFLEIEHSGKLGSNTSRPDRLARVSYDVIGDDKIPQFHESIIDVRNGVEVSHEIIDAKHHAALTMYGFKCPKHPK